MELTRRKLLIAAGITAAAGWLPSQAFASLPKLAKKDKYRVGFAQSESNNPWRIAQTKSMRDEAARLGHQLVYTDAASSAAKQAADVNSMIAQRVDLIFLTPREDKPLVPAVLNAKKAGIPVILLDRDVDHALAKPGEDYVTFIGSDFVDEGRRVAQWLVANAGKRTTILEIEGTTGSTPANDRKKGFDEFIKQHPQFKIVASQSGDFSRDKGRQTAQTLLQAHPEADIIYTHTDEMTLGAIAALEASGRKPGKDVLFVSIDGEKQAVQAIVDGKLGCSCECSPMFGPKAFAALSAYAAGGTLPPFIKNEDRFYDASNAKEALAWAY
ncbi:ABC transporter substrate-binding protein [Pararobbsia silviterrae]|uniref:ABC transporter substrate-binding protein n=1 Tax=Pararobbsia silviterrae TaxID=1792498 RepID=A0A494XMK0_9BURK|nr:ABC transporter substrate-binding protein [Pararobbsia silviterrae]RKP51848.1 ABC transporter substrate-binding protein [Pararobbsia silviterrae]